MKWNYYINSNKHDKNVMFAMCVCEANVCVGADFCVTLLCNIIIVVAKTKQIIFSGPGLVWCEWCVCDLKILHYYRSQLAV